jgi:GLE1-like protein
MKQISCLKQLESRKKQIKQRREELDKQIHQQWNELKGNLNPFSYVKETLGRVIQKKTVEIATDPGILKSSFTYGVTLLAKRIADRVEDKLGNIFKK